jgi:hypothetical protein
MANDRHGAPRRDRGPELLAMDGWDIDGRLYKARDEFGCTVMDWRSMIFTPSAP